MATKLEETLGPRGLRIALTVCPSPAIALDEFETRSRLPSARRPPAIALLFDEHMKHSSLSFRILHLKNPQGSYLCSYAVSMFICRCVFICLHNVLCIL